MRHATLPTGGGGVDDSFPLPEDDARVKAAVEIAHQARRRVSPRDWLGGVRHVVRHDVAVQVAFERQTLKPVFRLTAVRFDARRLAAVGQGELTCTAPPQPGPRLPAPAD
jgi:hypothetical protein